jgi:hypothetical protein
LLAHRLACRSLRPLDNEPNLIQKTPGPLSPRKNLRAKVRYDKPLESQSDTASYLHLLLLLCALIIWQLWLRCIHGNFTAECRLGPTGCLYFAMSKTDNVHDYHSNLCLIEVVISSISLKPAEDFLHATDWHSYLIVRYTSPRDSGSSCVSPYSRCGPVVRPSGNSWMLAGVQQLQPAWAFTLERRILEAGRRKWQGQPTMALYWQAIGRKGSRSSFCSVAPFLPCALNYLYGITSVDFA